jgi:hypothetical protein
MTRHAVWHMWRLREADDENLGLAFTDDNLLIGRTPLIEKHDGQFVVRQQHDIERLLSRAYRTEIRVDRLMSGLATVTRALNANDQCLARIAAVICAFQIFPTEMRATRWKRWMPSSNTRAMRAPETATGIRRCIHGPARSRIPAGSRRRKAQPTNHYRANGAKRRSDTTLRCIVTYKRGVDSAATRSKTHR